MTLKEKVIATAYTGIMFLRPDQIGELYKYLTSVTNSPAYTHEIPQFVEQYKDRIKADFIQMLIKE